MTRSFVLISQPPLRALSGPAPLKHTAQCRRGCLRERSPGPQRPGPIEASAVADVAVAGAASPGPQRPGPIEACVLNPRKFLCHLSPGPQRPGPIEATKTGQSPTVPPPLRALSGPAPLKLVHDPVVVVDQGFSPGPQRPGPIEARGIPCAFFLPASLSGPSAARPH